MSNKAGYLRYLKSTVLKSVDITQLDRVKVEAGWVLGLTDAVLREKQRQFLDKNGEPPPELVVKIAGEILEQFREIQKTLRTGEINSPKVERLIKNAEIREAKEEKKEARQIRELEKRGVSTEAARETIQDRKAKKIPARVQKNIPRDSQGAPILRGIEPGQLLPPEKIVKPGSGIKITQFSPQGKEVLTPPGLGFWNSQDLAKEFMKARAEEGSPYKRIFVGSEGNYKEFKPSKEGSLQKYLSLITKMMNKRNRPEGAGGPGSAVGSSGTSYADVELSEDGDDLYIKFDFPDDFEL